MMNETTHYKNAEKYAKISGYGVNADIDPTSFIVGHVRGYSHAMKAAISHLRETGQHEAAWILEDARQATSHRLDLDRNYLIKRYGDPEANEAAAKKERSRKVDWTLEGVALELDMSTHEIAEHLAGEVEGAAS